MESAKETELVFRSMEGNEMKKLVVCVVSLICLSVSGCMAPGCIHDARLVSDLPEKFGLVPKRESIMDLPEGGTTPTGTDRELSEHPPIAQR